MPNRRPDSYVIAYLYQIDMLFFAFMASGQSEEKFIAENRDIIESTIDDFQSGVLVNRLEEER